MLRFVILRMRKIKLPEKRKFFFFKILKSLKLRTGFEWARLGSNQRPSGRSFNFQKSHQNLTPQSICFVKIIKDWKKFLKYLV